MNKLALLVGHGELAIAAEQAVQQGFDGEYVVWSMVGGASDVANNVDVGQPLGLISRLQAENIDTLCAVGRVDLSPELRANVGRYLVEHYQGKLDMSDIGLETAYRTIAKDARVQVKGIQELMPDLLAGTGRVAGPDFELKTNDAENLIRLARTIARTDLGQSIVFHGSRPVAAEDVLGTDNLLERAKNIASSLKIATGELVLVKVVKPQQSGLGDLPTIGPRTIELSAAAGVGLVLVEGDKCLVADRQQVIKIAEQRVVSVVGWG